MNRLTLCLLIAAKREKLRLTALVILPIIFTGLVLAAVFDAAKSFWSELVYQLERNQPVEVSKAILQVMATGQKVRMPRTR
jgi:uncharacterized membrane protein